MKKNSLMTYFGQPIGNGQDPDEPDDRTASRHDGMKIAGKGSQGGGSKPTPQARPKGSGKIGSTAPRHAQRIRG